MSMELYNQELAQARETIREAGRSPDDFDFAMEFQEPDPDGGGMFTVRYDVTVTCRNTGKQAVMTGGIGLRWVSQFAAAVEQGYFDG
jgi:hypothetical protein